MLNESLFSDVLLYLAFSAAPFEMQGYYITNIPT